MASNLLDTAWRNFLQAGTKNKVGQAILPADTLSSVSRRRLKAGGSQDWLPHWASYAPYAAASAALNLTLTRRLTPGSCMVTPYNASAASIVFLEWVITTNWVLTDISAIRRVRRAMLASSSGASTSSITQNGLG